MKTSGRIAATLSLVALAAVVGAVVFTGSTDEPDDAGDRPRVDDDSNQILLTGAALA